MVYYITKQKSRAPIPQEQPQTQQPQTRGMKKLTIEQLKNAEYSYEGERRKFTNGIAHLPKLLPESASDYFVKIDDEKFIVFGDIDGNAVEDAGLVLLSRGGGSGSFHTLAVVLNKNGQAFHIASAGL